MAMSNMNRLAAILAALLASTACTPTRINYVPPAIDYVSAESQDAAGPPTEASRPADKDREVVAEVVARLAGAAGPLCEQVKRSPCEFNVELVESSASEIRFSEDKVLLSAGLARTLQSADEVAAVLAHQFAHVLARHTQLPTEEMRRHDEESARQLGAAIFVLLLAGPAAVRATTPPRTPPDPTKGPYDAMDELAADYVAVYLMVRAGFNPGAMRSVWSRTLPGAHETDPTWVVQHNAPTSRIAAIDEAILEAFSEPGRLPTIKP
ncbi:MAG: M48 family metalloprotease [Alphaproteobacteria bacterium]